MADQNSITAILAALAQQRPQEQPPQLQQPVYPPQPQYQAALPNSYPGAQYGLPQPTSSSSMDLSNIKPVSSGTVSISDAIAKAKAIAAQKGVSYDRPQQYAVDPRMGATRQLRPRSRSRSPPPARRDGIRDDFNPYRDERRSDRLPPGRDMYGRERSFSPNARARGQPETFSPPRGGASTNYGNRDRSPTGRGGGDEGSETIQIESNLVGLIIGRAGENLRRVETETGCRVQFTPTTDQAGPYRQCKISGPRARRQDVKNEINRIIDESGMGSKIRAAPDRGARDLPQNARAGSNQPALRDGEDSMQIMVPDRTVGLIIGRGGETIRDLQERSGCHVNIVGENKSINGLRPVNLIGTREAAAMAKDLIMEIVESDSKSQTQKQDRSVPQRDAPRDNGFGYGGPGGAGDKINDSVYVPSDAVGMIIGKGGETIKEMQNVTGCKINVSPSSGAGEVEREIGLVGTRESIEAAKRAIGEKVDAVQSKNGGSGGGRRARDDYNDRSDRGNYGQQQQQQQSYGGVPAQAAGQPAASAGGEDPYAMYGGYQAYVALWYQAMAAQQGGAAGPGAPPPGSG